ncbi:MAG: hypothetical protein ACRYG8_28930 [Janthinobacterium lividum]
MDDALMQAGLAGTVTYETIHASPFGTVRLDHVAIALPGRTAVTTGQLVLSGLQLRDGVLYGVHLEASDLSIPLLDLVRQGINVGSSSGLATTLLGTGITVEQGQAAIDYRFDENDRELSFSTTGRMAGIGGWSFGTRLVNVDPRWIEMVRPVTGLMMGQISNGLAELAGSGSLPPPRLKQLTWSLNDAPLWNRLQLVPGTPVPERQSSDPLPDEAQAARAFMAAGVPASKAREDAKTLAQWERKGGTLSFATDIEAPLPLINSGGLLGIEPAFPSAEAFVARSHGNFSD